MKPQHYQSWKDFIVAVVKCVLLLAEVLGGH